MRDVARSLNGVVEGRMNTSRQFGFCEIRGTVPNLWPWIVGSLGFDIDCVRFPNDESFTTLLTDRSGCGIKALVSRIRDPPAKLDVVFCDYSSLPPFTSLQYWSSWDLPHVVFSEFKPTSFPSGWTWSGSYMSHRMFGGCSTASWWVGVLHRDGDGRFIDLPPPSPSPYRPFEGVLQYNPDVRPLHDVPPVVTSHPTVIRPDGSYLSPVGLYPCHDFAAPVLVKSHFSASGFGTRALSLFELGSIWDMPISFLDSLGTSTDVQQAVSSLLMSCPGKLLFSGADSLLFRVPRGVGIMHGPASFDASSAVSTTAEASGGSKSDIYKSLVVRTAASTPQEVVDTTDYSLPRPMASHSNMETILRRNLLKEGNSAEMIDNLIHRLKEPIGEVEVKQEGQKADDAAIPRQMWDEQLIRSWDQSLLRQCPSKLDGQPWRLALEAHRRFWITRVRRLHFTSFWSWIRDQDPSLVRTLDDQKPSVVQPVWSKFKNGTFGWRYRWSSGMKGKNIYLNWHKDLRKKHEKSVEGARDCIKRSTKADFWEWLGGSRPYFWKWPIKDVAMLRDGQPHLMLGAITPFLKRQARAPSLHQEEQMISKLVKARLRDYIESGHVESLMEFFGVPKGPLDIRLVFNGTSCGLNANIFAPHFGLPTVFHTLRSLDVGTYACDIDIGECFLNFMLHEMLRKYSGVDVTHYRSKDEALADWEANRGNRWERWCRNWFGLTDSPYRCMQPMIKAKQIAYGDPAEEGNPFGWSEVSLNLPGDPDYDPSKGWVLKLTKSGDLACEVFIYIDDGRVTGPSRNACWAAAQRFASICNALGIQSAGRKRTPPSLTPGPWAGTVVWTYPFVGGTLTKERWAKTRAKVKELVDAFKAGAKEQEELVERARPLLDSSLLQSNRGFLNYVGRTYKWLPPYLKGLHLTIDIWRDFRDKKTGYALRGKERHRAESMGWHNYILEQLKENQEEGMADAYATEAGDKPPSKVQAAERLWSDLQALERLTDVEEPPIQRYRAEKVATVLYLLGDASGSGFGSIYVEGDEVEWQTGTCSEAWKEETSNYREANNITTRLEEMAKRQQLNGAEIFLITDNMVFEGCFYKGHSSSEKLSDIILRLRILERDHSLVLHVVHVSGKRMKSSGVDGLSRGDNSEGIMAGENPLKFIPLNLGAHERSGGAVESWVQSWWNDRRGAILKKPLRLLEPKDWFMLHEIEEARLWMPAPAAMETVLSLFNEDRLTRPDIPHVFCVPRLMTHLWRKALSKDADVLFSIEAGNDPIWTHSQFEPLVVAIVLPFAHVDRYYGPWLVRGTDLANNTQDDLTRGFKCVRWGGKKELDELERELQSLWKNPEARSRDILRKFLHSTRKLPPVQKCLVWPVLPGVPPGSVSQAGNGRGSRRRSKKRKATKAPAVHERKRR